MVHKKIKSYTCQCEIEVHFCLMALACLRLPVLFWGLDLNLSNLVRSCDDESNERVQNPESASILETYLKLLILLIISVNLLAL